MPRINFCGLYIDILNASELRNRFIEIIGFKEPVQAVTLNALMFNSCVKDRSLHSCIAGAGLVVPDSIGVSAATSILNLRYVKRQPGIDLIYELCALSAQKGWKIFLLGSKQQVVESASRRLLNNYPGVNICGLHHGYFTADEENALIEDIKKTEPDILLAGLDVPRQEIWINRNLARLNVPLVMGVGGSFDVISGRLKRAPAWMQAAGLEWFFRFVQEPWRITRIKGLPLFVLNVIKMSTAKADM